jgi:ATP-dependent DNA helicase PIF1
MRVMGLLQANAPGAEEEAAQAQWFARFLQQIGDGTRFIYPAIGANSILLPPDMCLPSGIHYNLEDLIHWVYGDLNNIRDRAAMRQYITERTILAPHNRQVDEINNLMADRARFAQGF